MNPNEMLGVDQVAKLLGLSREKVDHLISRGILPASPSAQGWKVSRAAVEAHRNSAGAAPAAAAPQGQLQPKAVARVPTQWQKPASASGGLQVPAKPAGKPAPPPQLVNEPVATTPASLELDLSILDKLEIPDPDDDEDD